MNELIRVSGQSIGNDKVNAVNARELYEFLEVKTHYSTWIAKQIKKYDFVINSDFSVLKTATGAGGDDRKDYIISIDMAKELSMVERNKRGRSARKYFIECEKKLQSNVQLPNFTDPAEAAIAWAEQYKGKQLALKEVEQKQKIINDQQPMVNFANQISSSSTSLDIGTFAKVISKNGFKIGRNNLFKLLREKKVLMDTNEPYQRYINNGWLIVVETPYIRNSETYINTKTKITPAGQIKLERSLRKMFNYQ